MAKTLWIYCLLLTMLSAVLTLLSGRADVHAQAACSIETSPLSSFSIARYKFARVCPSYIRGECGVVGKGVWWCNSAAIRSNAPPADKLPVNISSAPMPAVNPSAIAVRGQFVILPDDGWYQIQNANTYKTVHEGVGGRSQFVVDGLYNVINLTNNARFENVRVSTSATRSSVARSTVAQDLKSPGQSTATTDNRNRVIVGSNVGEAQCLNFGARAKGFGTVTDNDWKRWMPGFRFSSGEQFLSVEIGEDGKSVLRHIYVPSNRGSERVIMGADVPRHQTYRMTESVFLEPGWEWGGRSFEGGKLAFGFGGGAAPSGGIVDPAGFTARVMWRGNYLGNGEYDGTGRFVIYSYAADRPESIGEDIPIGDFVVPVGEWVQITYEIKANTSISSSDGHVRAWINGELQLDHKGMRWQTKGGKPVIDTLYYSSFYGGGSRGWAPSKPTYAKVKDICWAPVVNGYSGINPDNGKLYVD